MVGHRSLEPGMMVRIHLLQPWFDAAAKGGLAHHGPERVEVTLPLTPYSL